MKIIKRSGDIVNFDRNKLERSLLRSGALPSIVKQVLQEIEMQLHPGITTKQIYRQALALLKKASGAHAARYSLRSALQLLGPAGFYFEKFIARLYLAQGWETKTNLVLQGKCVSHEVDIAMRRDKGIMMAECKFHNSREAISDVKVAMYMLSRFKDLSVNRHTIFSGSETIDSCLIVTNNRFSSDAIAFAGCSGLELLSWDYPEADSIRLQIDRQRLYPVTCLTTISLAEKEKLLTLGVLLVDEIIDDPGALAKISLSEGRIRNVLKEAAELCNYK